MQSQSAAPHISKHVLLGLDIDDTMVITIPRIQSCLTKKFLFVAVLLNSGQTTQIKRNLKFSDQSY